MPYKTVGGYGKTKVLNNITKMALEKNCSKYRGLSIINSLSRIYGKFVKKRIEKEMKDIKEWFQAARSRVDSSVNTIFTFKLFVEKGHSHPSDVFSVYRSCIGLRQRISYKTTVGYGKPRDKPN